MCDNTFAPVADVAQCLAPHAMILPREGWEGRQHTQTPAAPLFLQYVALSGSEVVYLDRSEVKEQDFRCWTKYHLLAPNLQLTAHSLSQPTLVGRLPQWPHAWNIAVNTMRMAPREQRAVWPAAGNLLATAEAVQARQPTGNAKGCGVCTLLSTIGSLFRLPRPGNLLSTLDKRRVAAVALNRDMGPIARMPSLGELPVAVLDALLGPRTPVTVAHMRTKRDCLSRGCGTPSFAWLRRRGGCPWLCQSPCGM